MHDLLLDVVTGLIALAAAVTFAAMIWAASRVDGRPPGSAHAHLRLSQLHLPHMHPRRRA